MSISIFVEGGGNSKELKTRCREGFRKLFQNWAELNRRMPKLIACGSRNDTFESFKIALSLRKNDEYVGLLIDSETPINSIDLPWSHLEDHDKWQKPPNSTNDQVLFMATCMETWIVADEKTLKAYYGHKFLDSALPPSENLESRPSSEVQKALKDATRNCPNRFMKGAKSFAVLSKLSPDTLEMHLPNFKRVRRILKEKC